MGRRTIRVRLSPNRTLDTAQSGQASLLKPIKTRSAASATEHRVRPTFRDLCTRDDRLLADIGLSRAVQHGRLPKDAAHAPTRRSAAERATRSGASVDQLLAIIAERPVASSVGLVGILCFAAWPLFRTRSMMLAIYLGNKPCLRRARRVARSLDRCRHERRHGRTDIGGDLDHPITAATLDILCAHPFAGCADSGHLARSTLIPCRDGHHPCRDDHHLFDNRPHARQRDHHEGAPAGVDTLLSGA